MSDDAPRAEAVGEQLRTAVGDGLRAIVAYDDEGIEPVVLEDAARTGDPTEKLGVLRRITDEAFSDGPFGPHQASCHVFEDVTVVHVPFDDERGVVATVGGDDVDDLSVADLGCLGE